MRVLADIPVRMGYSVTLPEKNIREPHAFMLCDTHGHAKYEDLKEVEGKHEGQEFVPVCGVVMTKFPLQGCPQDHFPKQFLHLLHAHHLFQIVRLDIIIGQPSAEVKIFEERRQFRTLKWHTRFPVHFPHALLNGSRLRPSHPRVRDRIPITSSKVRHSS